MLVEKGGSIVAAMPYVIKRRFGFKLLSQPALTQTLGPWIKTSDTKYAKRLSREKDLMEELIGQLPRYHYFSQNWHFSQTNWLPFFWKGFSQTTRYTYRLENLSDHDVIWSGFQQNIRTDIRKANNREGLNIRTDLSVEDFLELNRQVFKRQGEKVPYTKAFVQGIDRAAAQHNARRIFIAEDERGRRHAGVYLVWDENSAYYLMGGADPELRKSGATSLCMWEAIRFASAVTEAFDFEGSMLEPVERFFRAFGATQTPYNSVSRITSKALAVACAVRGLIR